MLELVDRLDLGSNGLSPVQVQVLHSAFKAYSPVIVLCYSPVGPFIGSIFQFKEKEDQGA